MKDRFEFCFFHIGSNTDLPDLLAASIRKTNPNALISQLTDSRTPAAAGIDRCIRREGNMANLMYCRADAYARHTMDAEVCVFLDTDMLVTEAFDQMDFTTAHDIYLCRRFFNKNTLVNVDFRNMGMHEYTGKTLEQAWPYLGCMIICKSIEPMKVVREHMDDLPEKYKSWYGDQIALSRLKGDSRCLVGEISEYNYANINGERYEGRSTRDTATNLIRALHFKGQRKHSMRPVFERLIRGDTEFK